MTKARPSFDKQLGQHHLRSPQVAEEMLRWLHPSGGLVVEIGPGGGALTTQLVAAGARVVGLELDLRWAVVATREVPEATVCVADAMQFDWSRLPPTAAIAGNLPYNVATALIEQIFEQAPAGTRMGFLVQLEVADRIVAAPRTKAYGSYSVLAQSRAEWTRLNTVKPGSFHPPPKVHSAFVVGRVKSGAAARAAEWEAYEQFVRACFARRRKTLLNSLRGSPSLGADASLAPQRRATLTEALEVLGYAGTCRAEEVAVHHYVQLWQRVAEIGT